MIFTFDMPLNLEKPDQHNLLTDEEIQQLLSQAEARMRNGQSKITGVTSTGYEDSNSAWSE
jgi:hypothetical protein